MQPKRAFMTFYQIQWINNSRGSPKCALGPPCLQKGVEFVCKKGWNCPNNCKNLAIGPPTRPQMAKIIPELPPKGPPTTMYLRPVQLYITWGYFWPFWTRKRAQISQWLQSLAIRLPNWLIFVPNGPKMNHKPPQQYSIFVVSTTVHYLGVFRSFLGEERVETSPKLLIWWTYMAWFFNFKQP